MHDTPTTPLLPCIQHATAHSCTPYFYCPQEAAAEESQKYKEGKFILERVHVVESDSNSNMSPPRFRTFGHPLRGSDTSESESY